MNDEKSEEQYSSGLGEDDHDDARIIKYNNCIIFSNIRGTNPKSYRSMITQISDIPVFMNVDTITLSK